MTDRAPTVHGGRDDHRQDVTALLRRCVQCGLCLPRCATWAATGNEVHSPRGRLVLLADLLEDAADDAGATGAHDDRRRAYAEAFDLCIGCRACEAACPSGVPFSLLETGQALIASRRPPAPAGAVPAWVVARLESPSWLRVLRSAVRGVTATLRLAFGHAWRRRLARRPWSDGPARLLGSLPAGPGGDAGLLKMLDALCGHPQGAPARPLPPGRRTADVLHFQGCANEGLLPDTSRRLRQLLTAAGGRVTTPPGQQCCGALAAHTQRPGRAANLARLNRGAFAQAPAGAALVVEAAGCGAALQAYDPPLGRPVVDAVAWLAQSPLPPLGEVPLKVALHDPCHARHGQGIVQEPRRLLRAIPGLQLLEPAEAEVCCGSGGAWGLRHPQLSADLGRRKAGFLAATGADIVVTSNPGCLGQIADALAATAAPGRDPLPILPLTDLLWYAAQRARS